MNDGSVKRVICTGRLYCDLVMAGLSGPPKAGAEVYAEALTLAAGGGAYITAAYLAALGRETALAAIIPAEPFAGAIAAELADSQIDLAPCAFSAPGSDPQITVAMITGGDRAYVTRRSGPSIPEGIGAILRSRKFQHLHIGELATLADAPGLVAEARASGMTTSVDCAWDAELLARGDLVALLKGVDVFLPNRAEATALERHANLESYAPLVVVKDGAQGATAMRGSEVLSRKVRTVDVVDTVGAGDAFNAGFLDSWLDGATLENCLDAGSATAKVALSRSGGARGLEPLTRLRRAEHPAAE